MSDGKQLDPVVAILGYDFTAKTFGVVNLPVADAFTDPARKSYLLKVVLPKIFDTFAANNRQVVCFSLASEAWLTEGQTTGRGMAADWERLKYAPRKEVLMISFETEDYGEIVAYEIQRGPGGRLRLANMQVLDSRDMDEISGYIPDIFRKYNRSKQQ